MGNEFSDIDVSLFEPVYKAIGTRTGRHGIRLEQAYWNILKRIAEEQNCSVADLVGDARELNLDANNATSVLRVCCLEWQGSHLKKLVSGTDDRVIRGIVNAAPTPALALSARKHLHSFNQPFLKKLTDAFSIAESQSLPSRLRLVLDIQIETLLQQLQENGNRPIAVGIVIGIDERRLRSQMKVTMAPQLKQSVILGFLQP